MSNHVRFEERLQASEITVNGTPVVVQNFVRASRRHALHPMALKAFALIGAQNLGKSGGMFRRRPTGPRKVLHRTPRNASCPCGSGRKFKKCCLGLEY